MTPIALGLILLCSSVLATADEHSATGTGNLNQEILNLKHKIDRLEKSRIPLNRKEKHREQAEKTGGAKTALSRPYQIHLNGLVEIEASYADTPEVHTSDLTVSTVELGIDAQTSNWLNAHALILHEEDSTEPPVIDEAILTITNPDQSPWSLALGRMYVPFGNYDSNMVSDPLTLEIGETRETAVQGGYLSDDFHALVYLFNGDVKHSGNDRLDSLGFNLGLSRAATNLNLGYILEASWLNNLGDSDSLQDAMANSEQPGKRVQGLGVQASIIWKRWKLTSEYLGALESFDQQDLAFRGGGAKPEASNIEGGYAFHFRDMRVNACMGWQHSREALALSLPENRYLAAISVGVLSHTSLSLEYSYNEDYAKSQGGTGKDSTGVTLQLAASF